MIVYLHNYIHADKSNDAEQNLPLKIMHAVPIIYQSAVGACAIQHHQAETGQEYQHGQQAIVKITDGICSLFSCFFFSSHILHSNRIYYTQIQR